MVTVWLMVARSTQSSRRRNVNGIPAWKEKPQRMSHCRLKGDVINRVADEKGRIVDHQKILRAGGATLDPHQFDRHSTRIADLVVLRHLEAVRETDPGLVGPRLSEDANAQVRWQIVEHAKFGAHAAMRLWMCVPARGPIHGGCAHLRDKRRFDRPMACASPGGTASQGEGSARD